MKAFRFLNPPTLYLEIGQSSLKLLDGNDGFEFPLERLESGRLTTPCREKLTLGLRGILKRKSWQPRRRAFCAISARGVSLRRLSLPASTGEELQQLLALQIESEFPLSPNDLAWGYRQLRPPTLPPNAAPAAQELLVVAVKREALEESSEILADCGLNPVFTIGALARSSLCPESMGSYAVLDIGCRYSELISFDRGAPNAVRLLPWGGEDITRSIEKTLAISRDEAERLKIDPRQASASNAALGRGIQTGLHAEMERLARFIARNWTGQKLFLTGKSTQLEDLTPGLAAALGGRVECHRIEVMPGAGRSAAIVGLKQTADGGGSSPPLTLEVKRERGGDNLASPARWKWVALAALLTVASLALPHVEALFRKPALSRRLSGIKTARNRLFVIDRELSFLQYLKTNQPPYLDAMSVIASAAPAGARIESLSMNRRGDLSLRAAMGDSQQVGEFRSKLIASAFFSSVVADEQTPSPDRQKVVVRISARWNPARTRMALPGDAPRPTPEKTNGSSASQTN